MERIYFQLVVVVLFGGLSLSSLRCILGVREVAHRLRELADPQLLGSIPCTHVCEGSHPSGPGYAVPSLGILKNKTYN